MNFLKGHIQTKSDTLTLEVFERLYNEHFEPLCHYAQRFVYDLDTSREIVQDVFVKVWEKRTTLLDEESLRSYLYRSVHNKCLDYLKHLSVEYEYEKIRIKEIQEAGNNSVKTEDHPLEGLITEELRNAIRSSIENLPEKCREIFELSRFEGLKYREISEELNISIKTVETQISRAIKSLREQLSDILKQ